MPMFSYDYDISAQNKISSILELSYLCKRAAASFSEIIIPIFLNPAVTSSIHIFPK